MRNAFLASILLLAACAPVPPKPEPVCPVCPPPKPAPESARYIESTFEALPGWPGPQLERSLRAFMTGCPRPGPLANACTLAGSVPPGDEPAARQFFESAFVPYARGPSDGPDIGMI